MRRREFISGIISAAAVPALVPTSLWASENSLAKLAAAKGLLYGCAVKSRILREDAGFRAAVAAEVGILVPEYELKREVLQPAPGRYDFSGSDYIFSAAIRMKQRVRGHTLAWYAANPPWLPEFLSSRGTTSEKESVLTDYITAVTTRYKGRVHSWDVVNEAIEPDDGRRDGMRSKNIWFDALGENYIALAFFAAKAVDSEAILMLNEFGVEAPVRWNERRRYAVLKLLDRLKAQNVPIEGFGIQGHLHPYRDGFDPEIFRRFIRDLEGYNLKLMVTELDVSDRGGSSVDPNVRDTDVAAVTRDFLDVALDSQNTIGILTWGLSDRYTWLASSEKYRWPDGQYPRALPLDSNFQKKPMWAAIAESLEKTANRSGR